MLEENQRLKIAEEQLKQFKENMNYSNGKTVAQLSEVISLLDYSSQMIPKHNPKASDFKATSTLLKRNLKDRKEKEKNKKEKSKVNFQFLTLLVIFLGPLLGGIATGLLASFAQKSVYNIGVPISFIAFLAASIVFLICMFIKVVNDQKEQFEETEKVEKLLLKNKELEQKIQRLEKEKQKLEEKKNIDV